MSDQLSRGQHLRTREAREAEHWSSWNKPERHEECFKEKKNNKWSAGSRWKARWAGGSSACGGAHSGGLTKTWAEGVGFGQHSHRAAHMMQGGVRSCNRPTLGLRMTQSTSFITQGQLLDWELRQSCPLLPGRPWHSLARPPARPHRGSGSLIRAASCFSGHRAQPELPPACCTSLFSPSAGAWGLGWVCAKVISWVNFPPPGTALMMNTRKEDTPSW